jgi:hypothetical protein
MDSHEAAHANNSAQILALAKLLLQKGVFTPEEHAAAVAEESQAQEEFIRKALAGEPI